MTKFDHFCIYQSGYGVMATGKTLEECVTDYNRQWREGQQIELVVRNGDVFETCLFGERADAWVLPYGHGDIANGDLVIAPCTYLLAEDGGGGGYIETVHGLIDQREE